MEQPQIQTPKNNFCVAMPVFDQLDPRTEESLVKLRAELGDYNFYQVRGMSDIYRARCHLAKTFLAAGEHNCLWVDSGHVFTPDEARMVLEPVIGGPPGGNLLGESRAELCCGLYAKRRGDGLSIRRVPGRTKILMDGHLEPIAGTGFGFVATSRKAFEMVAPSVPEFVRWGRGYFFPLEYMTDKGLAWMGEDISFCQRLLDAGGRLYLHTGVCPSHVSTLPMKWWQFLPFEEPQDLEIELADGGDGEESAFAVSPDEPIEREEDEAGDGAEPPRYQN